MSVWKRKKLPSRPLTDAEKKREASRGKKGDSVLGPEKSLRGRSTKIIRNHDQQTISIHTDKTIIGSSAGDMPPDLVQSLHTAAVHALPQAKKNTNSLEDMNSLLQPLGFQCLRLLGTGGMGSVFLARDTKLQRLVAIKVLLPRLSGNQQFIELFTKEAETVAKFGHPNIVQVYAIHVVQKIYFIVMEYVEGTTLRDKIRREGKISEEITLRIMDQVTQALAETHAGGIIHRDIKPQNILITRDGIPKVADFGLAISVRESLQPGASTAGTPTYMAPEQARGNASTPASDIYSLGVVIYFMLTGKIPYKANSVNEVLRQISAGNKVDIKEFEPKLSPALVKIVRKSMDHQVSRRYLNMREFNTAVRDAWLAFQRRGLKPMLPRVKRAAWMYLVPPACLVAGLLLGYLVHNPIAQQTNITYEQAFTPRVEHLKATLGRILNQNKDDKKLWFKMSPLIQYLDKGLEEKDPEKLVKYISQAEFLIDWHEIQPLLLKLKETGGLSPVAQKEAGALWEAAQKENREAFYLHRSRLLDALK